MGRWNNEETWRLRKVISTRTSRIVEKDFGLEVIRCRPCVRARCRPARSEDEKKGSGMTDDRRRGAWRRKVRKFVEATPESARDKEDHAGWWDYSTFILQFLRPSPLAARCLTLPYPSPRESAFAATVCSFDSFQSLHRHCHCPALASKVTPGILVEKSLVI